MGLAEPRKRRKISNDPNNTTWLRATDNYGHKIMASQGWSPGNFLGVKNASHATHYTAANASHIRVLLREDNLGLGAQKGGGNAGTFGLDLYQDVLGRLNGKTDAQIQENEQARKEVGRRMYIGHKFGATAFVSGGFLIGDKIQTQAPALAHDAILKPVPSPALTEDQGKDGRGERSPADASETSKRRRSSRKSKEQSAMLKSRADFGASKIFSDLSSTDYPDSRHVHAHGVAELPSQDERHAATSEKVVLVPFTGFEDDNSTSQLTKQAKKEGRRLRKQKAAQKQLSTAQNDVSSVKITVQQEGSSHHTAPATMPPPSPVATITGSRHAVRQRYIRQKKMASLDPQALREIFMTRT